MSVISPSQLTVKTDKQSSQDARTVVCLTIRTQGGKPDHITVAQCAKPTEMQDEYGRLQGTPDHFVRRWFDCKTERNAHSMREQLKAIFTSMLRDTADGFENTHQVNSIQEQNDGFELYMAFEEAEREADDCFERNRFDLTLADTQPMPAVKIKQESVEIAV